MRAAASRVVVAMEVVAAAAAAVGPVLRGPEAGVAGGPGMRGGVWATAVAAIASASAQARIE
jgi:hypothetical protein